jgi:hypothetical protein
MGRFVSLVLVVTGMLLLGAAAFKVTDPLAGARQAASR